MQHPDSPTWCVKCGTFDCYADTTPCKGDGDKFNTFKPENFERIFTGMFGGPNARS